MKKILWIVVLLTVMISCKQEPTKITFENMTCCDYINYNTYYSTYEKSIDDPEVALESYESCEKGITTKPGIIFGYRSEETIGYPKMTTQIMYENSRMMVFNATTDIDPELTSPMAYYNLPKKGKYIVNLIANDKIIARGEIEYR